MKELIIVSGFLGSGKTTFLKELFHFYRDKKIAVIVNEYGSVGVDGALLSTDGMEVSEITNGSIFCVCRSDLFIEALKKAHESKAELVIVETSGLSDPLSSDEILEQLYRVYGDRFDFRGIVCLIDAKNFHRVIHTAVSAAAQVAAADLIVINKVDLVSQEQQEQLRDMLVQMNPLAEVVTAQYGKVDDPEKLRKLVHTEKQGGMRKKDLLSQRLLWEFERPVSLKKLLIHLDELKLKTYRIKGFVKTTEGSFEVEGVGEDVQLIPCKEPVQSFLVMLYHAGEKVKDRAKAAFADLCEREFDF